MDVSTPPRVATSTGTGPTPFLDGRVPILHLYESAIGDHCGRPDSGMARERHLSLRREDAHRLVWVGSSGGSRNVDSEKLISRVIACIARVDRPFPSRKTASWLPPNAVEVKTSAITKW